MIAENKPLALCWPILEPLILQSVCNGFAPGSPLCYLWLQRTLRSRLIVCVMSLMAQGAHRGRPVAAAPCTPGLRPAKSPLRGAFDLSLQAAGRAEAASLQNTALSPHPCGLPRPSGNVSAILRPPAPVVSAAPAPAMIWICRGCRPGKASAATRQKNRRTFSMPLRRHFLRPSGKTDKQAGKSKQTPRRRWLVA